MSRKIIGVTVGTTLPKPNFKQTDPTKGDYIRNKPDFEGLETQVTNLNDTLASKQNKITGTAGQFVIIGSDGNVTTKTIPYAEEASF